MIRYRATRLLFRRDLIETLGPDGVFMIDIEPAREQPFSVAMTRAQFERDFSNVLTTESWAGGAYHYSTFPSRARAYIVGGDAPSAQAHSLRSPVGRTRANSGWPTWAQPTDADLLSLARQLTPYVRFLVPAAVELIVEDNERHREHWAAQLADRGIAPDAYLWDRCATAFPGVRRRIGQPEMPLQHRRLNSEEAAGRNALWLDDNRFPKHVWSFLTRGGKADTRRPAGYSLAHLADHKPFGSRLAEETDGEVDVSRFGVPGLFTSVANVVFVPDILLRPTDAAGPLRTLLQRHATTLYGTFCNVLPPSLHVKDAVSADWDESTFDWAEPQGLVDYVSSFLTFRARTMDDLLARGLTA